MVKLGASPPNVILITSTSGFVSAIRTEVELHQKSKSGTARDSVQPVPQELLRDG